MLGRRCRNEKVFDALYETIQSLAAFSNDMLADLRGWTLEYTRFHLEGFRVKFRDILTGLKSNETVDVLVDQLKVKVAERAYITQRRSVLVESIRRERDHRNELRTRIRTLQEIQGLSVAELGRRCEDLERGFPVDGDLDLGQHYNLSNPSLPLDHESGSHRESELELARDSPHLPPAPRLAALSIETMTPPYVPTQESLAGILTPPLTPQHPPWPAGPVTSSATSTSRTQSFVSLPIPHSLLPRLTRGERNSSGQSSESRSSVGGAPPLYQSRTDSVSESHPSIPGSSEGSVRSQPPNNPSRSVLLKLKVILR